MAELRYFLEELLFILEATTSGELISSYFWQSENYPQYLASKLGLSDITLSISSEPSELKLL
ncbi:hypothetical protein L4C38_15160 [Vibrio kasasachensis]|uniref:hypothetical protein n=1 Tax=Vibrio kasasachensis TaxID=2910248 RepID=UPI003D12B4E0